MARVYADRVMETTTSTGTGPVTLEGAVTGYQAFGSALVVGDTCDYAIFAVDENDAPTGAWETGRGTYSAAGVLTRTAVQDSSTGSAVDFEAGTKFVMLSHNAVSVIPPADVGSGGQGPHRYWRFLITQGWNDANQSRTGFAELILTDEFDGVSKAVGGTASGSSGNFGAVFDGNPSTAWDSGSNSSPKPYFVAYEFVDPIQIVEARIIFNYSAADSLRFCAPRMGIIQYSDNGSDWVEAFQVPQIFQQDMARQNNAVATVVDTSYVPPYNDKVPTGGTAGQVLGKQSNDDGDTGWFDVVEGMAPGAGTAFPSSPAPGQRFFRSDRGLEYYWDGTRWLSTQLFTYQFMSMQTPSFSNINGQQRWAIVPGRPQYGVFIEEFYSQSQHGDHSSSSFGFTNANVDDMRVDHYYTMGPGIRQQQVSTIDKVMQAESPSLVLLLTMSGNTQWDAYFTYRLIG